MYVTFISNIIYSYAILMETYYVYLRMLFHDINFECCLKNSLLNFEFQIKFAIQSSLQTIPTLAY